MYERANSTKAVRDLSLCHNDRYMNRILYRQRSRHPRDPPERRESSKIGDDRAPVYKGETGRSSPREMKSSKYESRYRSFSRSELIVRKQYHNWDKRPKKRRDEESSPKKVSDNDQKSNLDECESVAVPEHKWSLHASKRYYISNLSPWCYSQDLGYFYFDLNGNIIYQDPEKNAQAEKKKVGKGDVKKKVQKTYMVDISDIIVQDKCLNKQTSAAFAYGKDQISKGKVQDTQNHLQFVDNERLREGEGFFENNSESIKLASGDRIYSEDGSPDLFEGGEYNVKDKTPIIYKDPKLNPAEYSSARVNSQSQSKDKKDNINIYNSSTILKNKPRHLKSWASHENPDSKSEAKYFYVDVGARFGYCYWSEDQKKYFSVPPDPYFAYYYSRIYENFELSHLIPNETGHLHDNYFENVALKLVVLSSKKLQAESVIIVDSQGLRIGRGNAEKNQLSILDIELSRVHCTIYLAILLMSQDRKKESLNNNSDETPQGASGEALEHSDPNCEGERDKYSHRAIDYNGMLQFLPDREFSKAFFIVDNGSTKGTFLNGNRLSASKTISEPSLLKHKDIIKIGGTELEVHLHPEWPCERCRVTGTNLIQANSERNSVKGNILDDKTPAGENKRQALKKVRILEFKRNKKRILDAMESSTTESQGVSLKYVDRAALRRDLYKDDDSKIRELRREKEPVRMQHSVETGKNGSQRRVSAEIRPGNNVNQPTQMMENAGSRILKKMGWTEGQGLGARGSGQIEPLSVLMRVGRAGLGSSQLT